VNGRTQDDFGDWKAEARALRSAVGVVELDHLAPLLLRGPDALSFLHRMSSADLQRIPDHRAVPAALLTPKARVICCLTVVPQPEGLLCILSREHLEQVKTHLERFIIADDVELEAPASMLLGLYGEGLHRLADLAALAQLEAYRMTTELSPLVGSLAIGDDHLATPGVQLLADPEQREGLLESLQQRGARRVGWRAYEACRVEAGTPAMGRELTEEVLILEAGQLATISFSKGCYPGQEPVCRIQSRGQVNRRLIGLRSTVDRPLEPAETLHHPDKANAGWVTSVARSAYSDSWLALGYLHRRVAEPGTALQLSGGGEAVVAELPQVPSEVTPLTCPRYKDDD
jgi:folate-binding protein YgfZ